VRQVRRHDDRLAVHAQNYVTDFQAALGRRAIVLNLRNQGTGRLVETEGLSQVLVHFLDYHTQPAAADLAAAFELIGDVHGHIDRDREGHAHEATGAGVYLRVDPHHFAGQVEQRTTGVARVDRHVGLDERHVVFVWQAATNGADDALGNGMVKAERRTDRDHPLTGLQVLGLAQFKHRQVLAIDFEQSHVGTWIGTNQLGLEFTAVGQAHENLVGIGNHVVVGEDVAVRRNDEAGAQGLGFALTTAATRRARLRHPAFEELAQHGRQAFQVGHLLVRDFAIRQLLRGTDVHNGRRGLLHQLGEVRQLDRLRR